MHDAAVRMHAPFGQTSGTTGVRQHSQIFDTYRQGSQCKLICQSMWPIEYFATLQLGQHMLRKKPIMPSSRRRIIALHICVESICEMRDHHMFKPLTCRQFITSFGQIMRQICRGDGNACIGVGDVVLELFRTVHWVDWDNDCIGAQDRKMRNHQLRAVLHVEHNAIAFLHAHTLQIRCQSLCLVTQISVG